MSSPDVPAGPGPTRRDLGFLFAELVDRVPEFVPCYAALVEAADDDPGEAGVLIELAGFVGAQLDGLQRQESALSRALGLVEDLLRARDGDGVGTDLVGYAFFDSFTIEDRRRLIPRLGPRSRRLLEALDLPPADDSPW